MTLVSLRNRGTVSTQLYTYLTMYYIMKNSSLLAH